MVAGDGERGRRAVVGGGGRAEGGDVDDNASRTRLRLRFGGELLGGMGSRGGDGAADDSLEVLPSSRSLSLGDGDGERGRRAVDGGCRRAEGGNADDHAPRARFLPRFGGNCLGLSSSSPLVSSSRMAF